MLPTVEEAERLLREGGERNPGPWLAHSRVAAECAAAVAEICSGMNPEKAYVDGLLHDIGRRFGVTNLAHVIDGYHFLMKLGYEEPARVCLTHSFADKDIHSYVGAADVPPEEYEEIKRLIAAYDYDDYDRLIQLCDSIAMPYGAVDLEIRLNDVEQRYGYYPEEKKRAHFALKDYFEKKMGKNLYRVITIQNITK